MVASYRELEVWQFAMDLSVDVYRLSESFPADERFGLTSQLRRSSSSVAANIAEGFGRESRAAFAQFLRVARGSLHETETHVELALRLGYLTRDGAQELLGKADRIGRMMRGLLSSLTRHPEPGTPNPNG